MNIHKPCFEGRHPFAVVSDTDFGQVDAAAKKKCTSKDVGGLKTDKKNHPLSK